MSNRTQKPIRSDIGWSTPDRISIFGKDLPSEVLGHLNLGDMGFLEIKGRLPDARESKMFNAMTVCLAEHGITPSAIVARMTYMGAPEALQAAVAAGLCGLGSVFVGSTETCARMLAEALPDPKAQADLPALAQKIVADFRARKQIVPGIGHPLHKPVDPRTPRLFEIAAETGYAGPYIELIKLVAAEAERASGKSLPINATGAIGAICCEMGFDWRICRGLGVMARAVGLVGHILEESRKPMAQEIWLRTEEEASEHVRPGGKPD
ncbi:MAG: citryl-CoA lyase [Betaproteobacteria bacterium]|nr:citryl-CoA lyase [Betaproteobacteria bacterium]